MSEQRLSFYDTANALENYFSDKRIYIAAEPDEQKAYGEGWYFVQVIDDKTTESKSLYCNYCGGGQPYIYPIENKYDTDNILFALKHFCKNVLELDLDKELVVDFYNGEDKIYENLNECYRIGDCLYEYLKENDLFEDFLNFSPIGVEIDESDCLFSENFTSKDYGTWTEKWGSIIEDLNLSNQALIDVCGVAVNKGIDVESFIKDMGKVFDSKGACWLKSVESELSEGIERIKIAKDISSAINDLPYINEGSEDKYKHISDLFIYNLPVCVKNQLAELHMNGDIYTRNKIEYLLAFCDDSKTIEDFCNGDYDTYIIKNDREDKTF